MRKGPCLRWCRLCGDDDSSARLPPAAAAAASCGLTPVTADPGCAAFSQRLSRHLRISCAPVRDKISEEDTILNMEKLYRSFMTKYSSRIDPEGAWLAYRLLVGKIAAILFPVRPAPLLPPSC